jgi:hypothetical protein
MRNAPEVVRQWPRAALSDLTERPFGRLFRPALLCIVTMQACVSRCGRTLPNVRNIFKNAFATLYAFFKDFTKGGPLSGLLVLS